MQQIKKLPTIGAIIRELCRQKGIEMLEGNAGSDHIHMSPRIVSIKQKNTWPPESIVVDISGTNTLTLRFRGKMSRYNEVLLWSCNSGLE